MSTARRIVVKIGSNLLTSPQSEKNDLDRDLVHQLADQIAALQQRGIEVTLVSSGAIGAGCVELALPRRPRDVADLQAVAAVGQRRLMSHLHEAFERHKMHVAQLLLTRSDFDDRDRFLNIRNCVGSLHRYGCLPVINENDTVAVDELRFGDNDLLAALMCNALRADALIILTVVEGLLDERGQKIDMVNDIASVMTMVHRKTSDLGTGGMQTKLQAARLVTEAGEVAIIADGRRPNVLVRLFDAERLGTVFVPAASKLDSRQRWIALTKRPGGVITIDDGAVTALVSKGKSLLASGVTDVKGGFKHGELVEVCDTSGRQVARGLINCSAGELGRIMGRQSSEFEKILGKKAYDEVIHRDNLVLMRTGEVAK